MGYAAYHLTPGQPSAASPFTVEDSRVQTPFYDAELRPDGTIARLYDKTRQRDVLPEGQAANVLQFYEDKPANWEAWDVEPQYADKEWQATVTGALSVVEDSPVRLVLACTLSYGSSTFQQRIVFYAHTPRIDFAHDVDWQERKTLVKVAFPVEVRSSRATYEIAYGAIERPTHWNTSWDTARFEVSGHRWADLSETGYGVSLLNDCKYGWDIHGNIMRLSLLRGPENPDPNADIGRHEYVYALFPHADDWRGGTVQEGASLNTPLIPVRTDSHAGKAASRGSFASVDTDHVLVDSVKKAEDSGEVILRLYEAYGARGSVTLTLEQQVQRAVETNLLEDEEGELATDGRTVSLFVKPFEVKTVKVRFA
jgi:alpha-mannosidase